MQRMIDALDGWINKYFWRGFAIGLAYGCTHLTYWFAREMNLL